MISPQLAFIIAGLAILTFGFIAGNIHGYAKGWSDSMQRHAEVDWPLHERKAYRLRSARND